MKTIFIVEWHDGIDMSGTVCAFETEEQAKQFIDDCYAWKEDFKKKFGKSYDELYDSYKLRSKHEDWLDEQGIDYRLSYSIFPLKLYEDNDKEQVEVVKNSYVYKLYDNILNSIIDSSSTDNTSNSNN